jgi:hypothetical protein
VCVCVCECFLPTFFEKDKQNCSQRVLGLVAYEIHMFLNFEAFQAIGLLLLFIGDMPSLKS